MNRESRLVIGEKILSTPGVDFQIVPVGESGAGLDAVRVLFVEYAESLGFSLAFQGFDAELATLPGDYAPPHGGLFLATTGNDTAGCVGMRRLDTTRCEMKRLYMRPGARAAPESGDNACTDR